MLTFDQARQIAASSQEVRRWFERGGVEISEWGSENSRDFLLVGRTALAGAPGGVHVDDHLAVLEGVAADISSLNR